MQLSLKRPRAVAGENKLSAVLRRITRTTGAGKRFYVLFSSRKEKQKKKIPVLFNDGATLRVGGGGKPTELQSEGPDPWVVQTGVNPGALCKARQLNPRSGATCWVRRTCSKSTV